MGAALGSHGHSSSASIIFMVAAAGSFLPSVHLRGVCFSHLWLPCHREPVLWGSLPPPQGPPQRRHSPTHPGMSWHNNPTTRNTPALGSRPAPPWPRLPRGLCVVLRWAFAQHCCRNFLGFHKLLPAVPWCAFTASCCTKQPTCTCHGLHSTGTQHSTLAGQTQLCVAHHFLNHSANTLLLRLVNEFQPCSLVCLHTKKMVLDFSSTSVYILAGQAVAGPPQGRVLCAHNAGRLRQLV